MERRSFLKLLCGAVPVVAVSHPGEAAEISNLQMDIDEPAMHETSGIEPFGTIVVANGGYIAINDNDGSVATSTDGFTWAAQDRHFK